MAEVDGTAPCAVIAGMQVGRTTALKERLDDLVECLSTLDFALPSVGLPDRRELIATIRNYLIPRLDDPDAPLVTAIGGLSGTGKSVLMNSLAGADLSPVGAVRPTTVKPVVWVDVEHDNSYWRDFVSRIRERVDPGLDVVVARDRLVEDMSVIDTPPLDLASELGSIPAARIAALADVCVFVTSAGRYADRRGWQFLEAIKRRGVPVLFVLNRTGDGVDAIRSDFANRLHEYGYLLEPDAESIFTISESAEHAERLPSEVADAIRTDLAQLSDPRFRQDLLEQTTEGAVRALVADANTLADAATNEQVVVAELLAHVHAAYREQANELVDSFSDGSTAWLADQQHWPTAAVDLTGMITRRAGVAAQLASSRWEEHPVGAVLLSSGGQGLWRHGHDSTYETQKLLEGWIESVREIVSKRLSRPAGPKPLARLAEELWPLVFDRERPAPKRVKRKLGTDLEVAVTESRDELARLVHAAMAQDGKRFEDYLDVGVDEMHATVVKNAAADVAATFDAATRGDR